jgi:ATP-dependent Lon protease
MATALMSLMSGRPVRDAVAMTGEITLTGQVLPIGGLKEKALAAQRNGINCVIAPTLNQQDVEDIPEHLREDLDFVWADEIGTVFAHALEAGEGEAAPRRRRPRAVPERQAAAPR